MNRKTFSEEYDLELDRITKTIKKEKAKRVLLQFPDGMKPYAPAITKELEKGNKNTSFIIWLGTCFGACDIPQAKVDLIVQFGHSHWEYKKIKVIK